MSTRSFDDLTKALATGTSRRSLLRGVLGAACGGAVTLAGRGAMAHDRTVEICHKTWAWSTGWRVITVKASDTRKIQAHLGHGDYLGPCVCSQGDLVCDGTGFRACENGTWIYRDCAQGTACRTDEELGAICDWPT